MYRLVLLLMEGNSKKWRRIGFLRVTEMVEAICDGRECLPVDFVKVAFGGGGRNFGWRVFG